MMNMNSPLYFWNIATYYESVKHIHRLSIDHLKLGSYV